MDTPAKDVHAIYKKSSRFTCGIVNETAIRNYSDLIYDSSPVQFLELRNSSGMIKDPPTAAM